MFAGGGVRAVLLPPVRQGGRDRVAVMDADDLGGAGLPTPAPERPPDPAGIRYRPRSAHQRRIRIMLDEPGDRDRIARRDGRLRRSWGMFKTR
ncbi:hypothetical protein [Marinactinospora rubrisoli]|uniref:Uncharacterized protein n=1 Tax=Marinactinospora rubrisoli TaxID=2715399 RepID=A0ABW2KKQ6_9ACTN